MSDKELALRLALAALIAKYEYICDIYCMKPETHKEYRDATELMRLAP
jgi:hypothetical protein